MRSLQEEQKRACQSLTIEHTWHTTSMMVLFGCRQAIRTNTAAGALCSKDSKQKRAQPLALSVKSPFSLPL